jgi:RimJ/RimL family protein N-acetyltransferase
MLTAIRHDTIHGLLGAMSPRHAAVIGGWVSTGEVLVWLGASDWWPLTPEKVVGWKRPGGAAFVYERAAGASGRSHESVWTIDPFHSSSSAAQRGHTELLAYGELNPMRGEADHFWLGHVIVNPRCRGRGIGAEFVRRIVRHGVECLGVRRVSLIVFPENAAAMACYRAAGFSKSGEEFHSSATSGDALRLIRMEHRAEA